MLLPALSKAKAKAKQTECLNNLKQVGLSILSYAEDSQDRVQFAALLDTKFTWGALVYSNQNPGSLAIFRCPSHLPKVYTNWYTNWYQTFGVWSDPPASVTAGALKEVVVLSAIQNPVNFHHLADTTASGRMGMGNVQFYAFRTNAEKEVHARHGKAANAWFIDGHAEGLTKARLDQFGIRALYGPDTNRMYYP